MVWRLGPAVLALALLVVLGVSSCVLADGVLLPAEPLSTVASGEVMAVAPNGYAAVVWVEALPGGQSAVDVAVRPPGGAWSAPQQLDASGESKTAVQVAVDANGDAAVAWFAFAGVQTSAAVVSSRAAGGAFATPERMPSATSTSSPIVGVAGDGRVTLQYGTNPGLLERTFAAGSPALAVSPHLLSTASCAPVSLAVAPSGDAVAGWYCDGAVFALRRAGAWRVSPAIQIVPGTCAQGQTAQRAVNVAIDRQGDAVGLLETSVYEPGDMTACMFGGLGPVTVTERLVLEQGGFMAPLPGSVVSERGTDSFGAPSVFDAQMGIAPSGIVVTWATSTQGVQARFAGLDGALQGPQQTIAGTPALQDARLAVGGDGRALLAGVQRTNSDPAPLAVAVRPPGGTFGAPVEVASGLPNVGGLFALGLDDAGDGAIAYATGTPQGPLAVRGFDAGAPTFNGVEIPAQARRGAPVAFTASASDMWGPVSLAWSFGDGASGSGGASSHAYATAGTRTVTVTATDGAGHAATRSGTVAVTQPAPQLSQLSLTHKAFRVGAKRTAASARRRVPTRTAASAKRHVRTRPPVGTTFRFKLDEAATVTIAIEHKAVGRRSGARCVKPTKRLRGHKRCTRWVKALALTRVLPAAADAVPFSGRVGRAALAPARYRATLSPRSGSTPGAARQIAFRVVR